MLSHIFDEFEGAGYVVSAKRKKNGLVSTAISFSVGVREDYDGGRSIIYFLFVWRVSDSFQEDRDTCRAVLDQVNGDGK
jgi:hypothetical protein